MAAANKPEDGRSQDGDDSPAEQTVVCQQTAQRLVYEAARSTSDLRCGDHVEVEWEGTWYQGCISDVPTSETYAVVYETGDFEVAVPRSAVRLGPKKPRQPKKATGKASKNKRANLERLCNAANESDLETIMELLREGVSTTEEDELGYAAVHWVCGPDHDQPGDTITRRACVALVGRASGSLELKARRRKMLDLESTPLHSRLLAIVQRTSRLQRSHECTLAFPTHSHVPVFACKSWRACDIACASLPHSSFAQEATVRVATSSNVCTRRSALPRAESAFLRAGERKQPQEFADLIRF